MAHATPLLILDLDETLIHSRLSPLPRAADHALPPYSVYRRPGVGDFLDRVAQAYRLAVWTSASPRYAQAITAMLFRDPQRLEFVWASDRCGEYQSPADRSWWPLKSLHHVEALGFDLRRVLMVDDNAEKLAHHPANHVPIHPFEGDHADEELTHLAAYLEQLHAHEDLRAIDKAGWRRLRAGGSSRGPAQAGGR